ncbi:MAG: hypothetical protein ABSD21_09525 [Rhizomicrobium sp.]|jgi:hypothetical protein
MPNEISEVTRRAIADFFSADRVYWSGRFAENDFLSRLYDLTKLPSDDRRFRNAAEDIYQHCVRNRDWPDDWVFYDHRFNLLHAPDDEFLKLLCESVHPIVQPDPERAAMIVTALNGQLWNDGWLLAEVNRLSGRPVYGPQKGRGRAVVFEEPTGWQKVDRQLQEVRSRLDAADSEEEYQAVGLLCREVLITSAQELYDPARHISADGIQPSATDSKRMLDAIFEAEFYGSGNDEARGHAKAAVKLALALQHKRTADFKSAALCAEGTTSVVNMLAVLAGRRGRLRA